MKAWNGTHAGEERRQSSVTYEFSLPGLTNWMSRTREHTGSKILMIPGFCSGDQTLYPLAWWLRNAGHRVFFAGIWWNTGCPRETIERLNEAVSTLYSTDEEKLVLIGHSLGGIYARELARRAPEMVERVILMGSAIRHPLASTNPFVLAWYVASRPGHSGGGGCLDSLANLCGTHQLEPPDVPETIIYTKRDEVVAWTSCLEEGPEVEAKEVDSSHYSMPYQPRVWRIILERLRRKQDSVLSNPVVVRGGPVRQSARYH
jgi:triacylglycerol lipase